MEKALDFSELNMIVVQRSSLGGGAASAVVPRFELRRRFLCYRNTGTGGDGAGVCSGFGYEVGFEVFDEAVVVGVMVLEMPEAVGEVEFAVAGYGFVEVDDKSFADGDVFDVHDRGISAHLGKDVVQTVGAGIDLA